MSESGFWIEWLERYCKMHEFVGRNVDERLVVSKELLLAAKKEAKKE